MKVKKEFKKNAIKRIDFNINLLETDLDTDILQYVSSVNINALAPITSLKSLICAAKNEEVVIGALIELPKGFKAKKVTAEEIEAIVIYQLGALMATAKVYGAEIEQVRFAEDIYRRLSEDLDFAVAAMQGVKKVCEWINFVADTSKTVKAAAETVGINLVQELFLDKMYNEDCSVDYSKEVSDTIFALNRLQKFVTYSEIYNNQKGEMEITADSVHFANLADLIRQACDIIAPTPFNFNKAAVSGWVG